MNSKMRCSHEGTKARNFFITDYADCADLFKRIKLIEFEKIKKGKRPLFFLRQLEHMVRAQLSIFNRYTCWTNFKFDYLQNIF
jgi:hypothetical protein